jgi:hypothetical protein
MQSTAQLPYGKAGQVDIRPLLGIWVNSNRDTNWINRFILSEKDGAFTLRVFGAAGLGDCGEVEITTYTDNIGEMAFHAVYDLGIVDSLLAANTNKGLIVIAAFHRFKDGSGRSNFLCREFYFREDVNDKQHA